MSKLMETTHELHEYSLVTNEFIFMQVPRSSCMRFYLYLHVYSSILENK